jgi:hypothetical protein
LAYVVHPDDKDTARSATTMRPREDLIDVAIFTARASRAQRRAVSMFQKCNKRALERCVVMDDWVIGSSLGND